MSLTAEIGAIPALQRHVVTTGLMYNGISSLKTYNRAKCEIIHKTNGTKQRKCIDLRNHHIPQMLKTITPKLSNVPDSEKGWYVQETLKSCPIWLETSGSCTGHKRIEWGSVTRKGTRWCSTRCPGWLCTWATMKVSQSQGVIDLGVKWWLREGDGGTDREECWQ